MCPEDLDEGDLEGGYLAVHEDACQVQLYLEAHVHVGSAEERMRVVVAAIELSTRRVSCGKLIAFFSCS